MDIFSLSNRHSQSAMAESSASQVESTIRESWIHSPQWLNPQLRKLNPRRLKPMHKC